MSKVKVAVAREDIEKEFGKEAAFEFHKLVKKELKKNSVLLEYIERHILTSIKNQVLNNLKIEARW